MDNSVQIAKKKRQFLITSVLTVILTIAIAVMAVLIAYKIPWRYDMTGQKVFTLSEDTKAYLETLDQDIRIAAVYPTNQENPYVASLLREYEKQSDHIKVEYVDAEKNPSALANYNLGDVQAIYNGTLIVEGPARMRLIFSDKLFESGSSGNIFYGEREITGAIRYVASKELPKVYFTQGHGENSVTNDLSDAINLLQLDAYEVNTCVMLQNGIPEDADILIMSSPKTDIDVSEQKMLADFLNSGKSLLLMVDPVMNKNGVSLDNLNTLMHEYGIDISNNYVVEENPEYYLTTSNMYLIPRFGAHEITKPIGEAERMVVMPLVRGLGGVDYDTSNVKRDVLLLTSDNSWARSDVSITEETKTPRDVTGPIPVGMAASKGNAATGNESSRVVVLGDSTFTLNGNVSVQANGNLLVNSVNWLNGSRDTELISGKVINSDTMIVRGDTFTRLAVICCVILPLIAFAGAFAIWQMRKNR